jgi:hypothetical protein
MVAAIRQLGSCQPTAPSGWSARKMIPERVCLDVSPGKSQPRKRSSVLSGSLRINAAGLIHLPLTKWGDGVRHYSEAIHQNGAARKAVFTRARYDLKRRAPAAAHVCAPALTVMYPEDGPRLCRRTMSWRIGVAPKVPLAELAGNT